MEDAPAPTPGAGQVVIQARAIGVNPVERDVMHLVQEVIRVDVMLFHQTGERRSMLVEMGLLDALRFDKVDVHQALDIGAHALVDQREQTRRRRIKAIVEVEDPVADMGEARVQHAGTRLAANEAFIKMKGFVKHKMCRKPLIYS